MRPSQQLNKPKTFERASLRQRFWAGFFCLAVFALFAVLNLAANGTIGIERWLTPCGFKQRYDLPCPTCGMTTSAIAFAQGKISDSFYIQPAAAIFCFVLAVSAFLALLTSVFGVYFRLISRFFAKVKIKYIILVLLIIIATGWAVTLARALAER